MRKAFTYFLTLLMVLALFSSCQESSSVATMRITLNSDTDRLIAPEGVPLDVVSYHITGAGPSGDTFDITTTKTSATLSGVAVGEWNINATGLNSQGDAIVTGSITFTLSVNNPGVVVRLNSLVGSGNLSVSMKWDTDVVSRPRIELELTAQDGSDSESLNASMNTSEGTATITKTALPSGSYILQGRLYSDDILMSGFSEAVRIVADATSAKEIEFNLDNFPYSPGTLQLLDQSGVPVECTVEGLESEVNAGESIEISLVPSRGNLSDMTVKWYVDGELVDTGSSVSITFQPGAHRLDAVAYTNKIGSYGSCSMAFNALVKTEIGVPGNPVRLDANSTGLKMGANTVMKFMPDGKLIVVSGINNSLQIATMMRNTVDVVKEYGVASIPALTSDPVDFDYHLLDGSGTYAILMAMNSPTNSVRLNYSASTNEIRQIEECDGIRTTFNGNTDKFSSSVGMVGFDTMINNFVFIGLDSDGKRNFLLERYVPSVNASSEFASRGWEVSDQLEANTKMDMDNIIAFTVSPDGMFYLAGNAKGNIAKLDHRIYSNGMAMKSKYSIPSLDNSKYAGLKKIEISDEGIAYMLGDDYIAGYDTSSDKEIFFKTISGASFSDFAINNTTGNLYLLSAETMKLYSYSIDSSGNIGGETVIDTLNSNRNIELSLDGSYLIMYTKENASNIEIMRIRTA